MNIKSKTQIEYMRESGRILSVIMRKLVNYTKPGLTTKQIDEKAEELLKHYNVQSAFKNFNNYPASTCISVNEEIVHGLPSKKVIKNGDIVSIDFGVKYKGYCSDSATTIAIGKISKEAENLINITKNSLRKAINTIKPNIKLGDVQYEIQKEIEKHHLGLIRELTGHGIGKNLQEEPAIPNYGQKNTGLILKPGMTFCIEPMVTLGNGHIKIEKDGWTITSKDGTLAAHFEHTLLVTKTGCEILTK